MIIPIQSKLLKPLKRVQLSHLGPESQWQCRNRAQVGFTIAVFLNAVYCGKVDFILILSEMKNAGQKYINLCKYVSNSW